MKLSKIILDDAGKPTFRIERPDRYEPKPPPPSVPRKSFEALRHMVHADDENRTNAAEWVALYAAKAADHERYARVFREAEQAVKDALSEAEL